MAAPPKGDVYCSLREKIGDSPSAPEALSCKYAFCNGRSRTVPNFFAPTREVSGEPVPRLRRSSMRTETSGYPRDSNLDLDLDVDVDGVEDTQARI